MSGFHHLPAERRLAAILAADVVGYSRLMGADELGTLRALKAMRGNVLEPLIASCRGRIVKTTGDGVLAEFSSVVDAVNCAVSVQRERLRAPARGGQQPLTLRIGVNIGDIIIDGTDIYGDGVNLAARLESICEPGGVTISRAVHEQVHDKLDFPFVDLGDKSVKNIARPVRVFALAPKAIGRLTQAMLPEPPVRWRASLPEPEEEPARTPRAKPRWKFWRPRLILAVVAILILSRQPGVRHAVENFVALVTTTRSQAPKPQAPPPARPAELAPLPPPIVVPLPASGPADKPAPADKPSPAPAPEPAGEATPPEGGDAPPPPGPPLELHPKD
jgi:class 3 adenylate cyclase